MLIFSYILLGFLLLRWMVGLGNVLFPATIPKEIPSIFPLVSILIPVRNEALNLPALFEQLSALTYPHLEIILLNDQSEDETASILAEFSRKDPRFRHLDGATLPSGWLGKNWACHQLAAEASGAYFLFMDADICYLHEDIISYTLACNQKLELGLLSIFPDQVMHSGGEKAVIPLMHYLLISMLPLWWIYRLPFPAMAAANGQFMLFHAEKYRIYGWHERVKDEIVEDMAIMRHLKQQGIKGMTFVDSGLIKTRMYQNFRTGVEGFSKNMLAGFGNSIPAMWIFLLFVGPGWVLLGLSKLSYITISVSLLLVLSLRGMISYLANQNILHNSLLHPLQILVMLWIAMRSTWKKLRGKNEWKGRNVQL